jgi:hypothetical protein
VTHDKFFFKRIKGVQTPVPPKKIINKDNKKEKGASQLQSITQW